MAEPRPVAGGLAKLWALGLAHFASLASIGVRGLSVLAGFAIAFLIGGWLGPEALGTYALVTQTAMFLSIVAVGGLDLSIVRFFPKVPGEPAFARKSVLRMFGACLAICLVLVAGVMVFGGTYFSLFEEVEADLFLLSLLAGIFVSRAFTRATSAFLRSQRHYVFSQIVEVLLIPLPVLALIVLGVTETVRDILLATALVGALAIAIGLASSFAQTTGRPEGKTVSLSPLYIAAMPLWGVAILKNFGDWYGLSVVSSQLSVAEAGIYRVAWQIATSIAFITIGLFGVFSPQIGTAVAQGQPDTVARLARTATRLSIALSMPAILLLATTSGLVLELVGPEYIAAQLALLAFLGGQAILVVTGPTGIVLALMGRQKVNLTISLVAIVVLIVAVPLGAANYGLTGAATAVAIVAAGQNIATYLAVRILLRIDIWRGLHLDSSEAIHR